MNVWPHGKRAAFTIIDDTDDATLPYIADVYEHLISAGLRTSKTVWVYPVRDDQYFRGDSLSGNPEYLSFIQRLVSLGYEIGLHNVGSGDFTRDEIVVGVELFNTLIGYHPKVHVNHSYNKDNIYGGEKRFSFPFDFIVKLMHRSYTGFEGELTASKYYWGDVHKRYIKYSRSYELDDINLLKLLPFPYTDKRYSDCCNAFYPSVFCANQDLFAHQVNEKNILRLIDEGGCAIIYTHLGYYCERGDVDHRFIEAVDMLKKYSDDLWIAPVSEVLDHMAHTKGVCEISRIRKFYVEMLSLWTRLKYRYIVGLDDYHYKKSIGMKHRAETLDVSK